MQFDLVVLAHTYGPDELSSDHLSAHKIVDHVSRIREESILKNNGRVFSTHIAHEGNPYHTKLVEFASQHGYDGLKIAVEHLNMECLTYLPEGTGDAARFDRKVV